MEDLALELAISSLTSDPIVKEARSLVEKGKVYSFIDFLPFVRAVAITFYQVGLIGLKIGSQGAVNWRVNGEVKLRPEALGPEDHIYCHPMFYRALSINTAH